MLRILDDFSQRLDRYYNFDVLVGDADSGRGSPINKWFEKVTLPVLDRHHGDVFRGVKGGDEIDEFVRNGWIHKSRPWERMYLLEMARSMAELMDELGTRAMGHDTRIPYLGEFYSIFRNESEYFKGRKSWSIYQG